MRKELITLGLIILLTLVLVITNASPLFIISIYSIVAFFRDTIVNLIDKILP